MKRRIKVERGHFSEIVKMPKSIRKKSDALLQKTQEAEKTDEHGTWEFGIIGSNYDKGMIHTINTDFYGVGYDMHNENFLAVVQVREFYREKMSRYPEIRKNYFLLGENEDGNCFAHAVESRVIHSAIKRNKDVIKAVQDWIFGTDYSKVLRQGDVCLKPLREPRGNLADQKEKLFEDSHLLTADKIWLDNQDCYCLNPQLKHTKGTHPDVSGVGFYKVIVAKRADFWRFAAPTLD